MKHFNFKSGCVVRVENGKVNHQLQPRQGCIILLHSNKRHISHPSVLTRRSVLVVCRTGDEALKEGWFILLH